MLSDIKIISHEGLLSGKYEKLTAKMPAKVRCYSCLEKSEDAHTDKIAVILAPFTAQAMDQIMENLYDSDYITDQIRNLTVYPETWVLPIPETLVYDLSYHMKKADAFDYQVIPCGDIKLIPYRVMHFDKNPLPISYRKGLMEDTTKKIGLCVSRFSNYDMLHNILPLLQHTEPETEETLC